MEEEIYAAIDEFLNLINNNNGDTATWDRYSSINVNAFDNVKKYNLAIFLGAGNIDNIAHITPEGKRAISMGGSKNYIESIINKQDAISALEFSKLKGEVEKLKYDIPNSKQLNDRDTVNKIIAIAALIISIIALIWSILK